MLIQIIIFSAVEEGHCRLCERLELWVGITLSSQALPHLVCCVIQSVDEHYLSQYFHL